MRLRRFARNDKLFINPINIIGAALNEQPRLSIPKFRNF